jgi:hypothetical protein
MYKTEYLIVWWHDRISLEDEINERLNDGWDLHGPTFYQGESWNQVVTRLVYDNNWETVDELQEELTKSG